MFKVNNKKAVRRLAAGSFKASRTRNIIAAGAIALTTILFTALFTIGSGMVENFQKQTMRQAGGDGMGVLKYLTERQYQDIHTHPLIEEISYNRLLADSVDNDALIKRRGEFYYMDETARKLAFCEPATGRAPEAANEIIMDTKTMKLLGVPRELGAPVTLELTVHGEKVRRDFVLSGWWEADPVANWSILVASRAYTEQYAAELAYTYDKDRSMTGVINSYVMFANSWGLEEKMDRIVTESGYSLDQDAPDYVAHNENWAYLSTSFTLDAGMVTGVLAALALIILAGYLIIYNIFQISVLRDIRFYGLLKTIGTTGKQIKSIIRRQALLLSCIGIPAGLLAGFFIGCQAVPLVMNNTIAQGMAFETTANPWIFVGSILFALATVFISTSRPGQIAARVSPVEALRFAEGTGRQNRRRKRRTGSRVAGMAAANMGRSKKRTALVVLSMSLSLVLFNTLFTVSQGFDMDKYIARFVDTDFLVAHADYFNYQYTGPGNAAADGLVAAVQQQPGFQGGGRYLGNFNQEMFSVEMDTDRAYNVDEAGRPLAAVYGLDDLPLERVEVLEGEIDPEKLKSGRYILEGIPLNDQDQPLWDLSHYQIGDTVTLHNRRGTHQNRLDNTPQSRSFEVMAKVAVKYFTGSNGRSSDFNFYLPAGVYEQLVDAPGVMSYAFNVEDGEEAAMDAFLQQYTETAEPMMNYSSKNTRVREFESMRSMVLLVGGALSLIIGLIGILNFINSMLTSIVMRRREFAMLESIGMTGRQLRRMLMLEGLYYAVGAAALSLALGALCSGVIVRELSAGMWFFSYQFTLLPLFATIPILLLAGAALPAVVMRFHAGASIVQRLREADA